MCAIHADVSGIDRRKNRGAVAAERTEYQIVCAPNSGPSGSVIGDLDLEGAGIGGFPEDGDRVDALNGSQINIEPLRITISTGPACGEIAINSVGARVAAVVAGRNVNGTMQGEIDALNQAGVASDFSYVSTAGGAFLEWMEGKPLPGVEVLKVR